MSLVPIIFFIYFLSLFSLCFPRRNQQGKHHYLRKNITNCFSERDLTLSALLYFKTFTSTASIEIVQANENSRLESVITGNY